MFFDYISQPNNKFVPFYSKVTLHCLLYIYSFFLSFVFINKYYINQLFRTFFGQISGGCGVTFFLEMRGHKCLRYPIQSFLVEPLDPFDSLCFSIKSPGKTNSRGVWSLKISGIGRKKTETFQWVVRIFDGWNFRGWAKKIL